AREILIEREIKNPWTKIFLSKENNKNVITINDNAGGIQKNIIEKIFDPYFSTKQKLTGTGIGLYMAKMVIERNMTGKLTVRNTDVGTEFRIEV
ncbi:MAG: ATP-binding protein, partial [Candidatus Stygibacter frigidus]|nr:ATP-binding protein [Candidatus Stygibacter frigidus]